MRIGVPLSLRLVVTRVCMRSPVPSFVLGDVGPSSLAVAYPYAVPRSLIRKKAKFSDF